MDNADSERLVVNEDAANSRYLEIMRRKIDQKISVSVSRSATWTGSGLPIPTVPTLGSLVGRVGLDAVDVTVGGSNFYIGPWHVDEEDLVVFSWAAPVAAAYYAADGAGFQLDAEIVCRRALSVQDPGPRVVGVNDEWVKEHQGPDPFLARRRLVIPLPPAPAIRREEPLLPSADQDQTPIPAKPASSIPKPVTQLREIRAESAVRRSLSQPRKHSLPSLLGTLQPDQYDFVSRPTDKPLVIQGHPGTGKTVIASHRAAYLSHPDIYTQSSRKRILLVGPTDYYAKHVAKVLDSLILPEDRANCVAMGVGQVLTRMRNINQKVIGALDATYFEVSYDLGHYIDAAAYELQTSGELDSARSHIEKTKLVYEALRTTPANGVDWAEDPDHIRSMRSLPPWKTALALKKYLPLVTQCAVSHNQMASFSFDHIIVDEAQDVRPLEWRLLATRNRSNSWTLLGDMNQRRTDHCYQSWESLVSETQVIEDISSFHPSTFVRGYRSTSQIMGFANQLLPRSERKMESIQQDGPKPSIIECSTKELYPKIVSSVLDLVARYPEGTVAIIIPTVTELKSYLLREAWTQDARDKRFWSKTGLSFSVVTPEIARGLEFDAVIVVEPQSFPTNLARLGALYTSLTRANRELVVIHTMALPDELRQVHRHQPKH